MAARLFRGVACSAAASRDSGLGSLALPTCMSESYEHKIVESLTDGAERCTHQHILHMCYHGSKSIAARSWGA